MVRRLDELPFVPIDWGKNPKVKPVRRWAASGVRHAVARDALHSRYTTACGMVLKVRSHRAINDHGLVTCLRCVAKGAA